MYLKNKKNQMVVYDANGNWLDYHAYYDCNCQRIVRYDLWPFNLKYDLRT